MDSALLLTPILANNSLFNRGRNRWMIAGSNTDETALDACCGSEKISPQVLSILTEATENIQILAGDALQ